MQFLPLTNTRSPYPSEQHTTQLGVTANVSAALSLKLLGVPNSLFDVKCSFHDPRPELLLSDKYLARGAEIRPGKFSLSPCRVYATSIRF
jgi:hypothetical protein